MSVAFGSIQSLLVLLLQKITWGLAQSLWAHWRCLLIGYAPLDLPCQGYVIPALLLRTAASAA